MVTANYVELLHEANQGFVQGTRVGSRKAIALRLSKLFNFDGGYRAAYRAAYRAVKAGYASCDTFAGKMQSGKYGINCRTVL
jgi:hypothetical protein